VEDTSVGDAVLENSIYSNTGQAIDLNGGGVFSVVNGVTGNSTSPRQGPNNLQNFPIILAGAGGRLEGWLGGSLPVTTFRIDVFASAGYGPGGAGEAEDDLGSLEVTTNATGQVSFEVPFTAPAGLPIITATATDPQGNTSEVSSSLPGGLQAQSQLVRLAPGQESLAFSPASDDGIDLQDSVAGSSALTWDLSLAVSAGTLTLPSIAGLVGSGDGTGSLFYSGTLMALNTAMDGMTYAPPAGFQGNASLSVQAQSDDITLLAGQVLISTGSFVVTTTADSGPGSLRQAILDSNAAKGATNTIAFDIPGQGVQPIDLASPLPPITSPVSIDGTSQPGYAGTPLIELIAQDAGTFAGLTITGSDVTVRGVTPDSFRFGSSTTQSGLTIPSAPLQPGSEGSIATYQIDTSTESQLVANLHSQGLSTRLVLLDSQGRVLVSGDSLASTDPDHLIDEDIAAGTYALEVLSTGAQGTYTLTTFSLPVSPPFEPIPAGIQSADVILPGSLQIVAGDFRNDGKLDLALSNDQGLQVLLGNGDGTFQPPETIVSASLGAGDPFVAGDFTGDGNLDLAVANVGGVAVGLGNGDGTFQPPTEYVVPSAAGGYPTSIVAGDFNGDGKLDLAITELNIPGYGSELVVLMGNGDGSFQPGQQYAMPGNVVLAGDLLAGDFTGNGRLDLAVLTRSGVDILLGNGDGTFQPAVNYPAGNSPDAFVAGDFTGDGKLDLAIADQGTGPSYYGYTSPDPNGGVTVLLGNGDGTFQPGVEYPAGRSPNAIVAGDFTGDGKLDLAVISANADAGIVVAENNDVSVLMGNGDGTFRPAVDYGIGNNLQFIVAGDFTGDGKLDLAVLDDNGSNGQSQASIDVLLNTGNGAFQNPASSVTVSAPISLVAADLTGNGRTDLVSSDASPGDVSVLLGHGDGTFQLAEQYGLGAPGAPAYGYDVVAGDFNGDGRNDLAVLSGNQVDVLLGNGNGTFQPPTEYALPTWEGDSVALGLVVGHFRGDGEPLDLVVTDFFGVQILLGNGDGTFQPAETVASVYDGPLVAGDFTGDGHLDLAVAGCCGSGVVSVLLGNGDGTFQAPEDYPVPFSYFYTNEPTGIVAGDFTGNGRLDLAVVVGYQEGPFGPGTAQLAIGFEVEILLGNGDGTFQPAVRYALPNGSSPVAIVAGDFTGDGKLDLAVALDDQQNNDGEVAVLLSDGDGTFEPPTIYPVGLDPQGLVVGDFNGDGKLDLAVANAGSNEVSILLGNGNGTFSDPAQFATTPHADPLVADVTGDGTDDVLVVDGAGDILYRQAIPGQPGTFEPPVTVNPNNPSRDIAWLPNTDQGPVLASVDAQDNAISFYAYRDGGFVRLSGSLTTGQLPAQIIAADLSSDGLTDLVVRNAGDGTLSVYFGTSLANIKFTGPVNSLDSPTFLPPVTLPVGLGVSDVQAVDTTGSGVLDLVVTNKRTGQVSILRNLGDGSFAAPVPYRAGTGLSAIDPGSTPDVTSLEATAGVAAGPLTPGGPTSLATINPGSNTLDVLAGLGGGRFANPVTVQTPSPAQVVRIGDFTGNGIDDLAVLTTSGVSIYLGDGKGGFLPPVTYNAGTDPTGLTVADLYGDGRLDLLVGDVEGDVLILVGNGNGTFRPFEPVKAAIALAVADLTGNGVSDFVFADQSLNQVTVVYGTTSQNSTNPQVIANQSSGLLAPGAVKLADLNGDGIPDLIVANSGGNDVLVYPGLGNGQFGPSINGTTGFAVGTDPTGLTVANLNGQPDLLVANTGSNDISVLLGQGSGSSWSLIPGPRIKTDAGPVAMVVGNLLGGGQTELAVANSQADNVQVFPSVGSGFFNDQPQAIKTYSVGQDPAALFLGNFSGLGLGLATLNAGSNNGTLISNAGSANPVIQSFATGGNSPITGFAGDFNGNGYTDLVIGNNADGHLALLLGGSGGLSLSQSLSNPAAPNPTAVSFGGLSDGVLSFYVSTAGREAALQMTFDLGAAGAILGPGSVALLGSSTAPGVTIVQVAQLGGSSGSVLDLIATFVTLTIVPGNLESELESAGGGTALLASFSPGTSTGLGQSLSLSQGNEGGGAGETDVRNPADSSAAGQANAPVERLAPWARFAVGLDEAWQELRARLVGSARAAIVGEDGKASGSPRVQTQAPSSLAPSRADPSRSELKSRSRSRGGDDSADPGGRQAPTGATRSGAWRNEPVAGVSVSSRTGFPPVVAAVDAALEELGESVARPNRVLRIEPSAIDEQSDSPVQGIMEIAAAAMALSMTWERGGVAGRARREARRVPRLRRVGRVFEAHRFR